eukprot:TRINITY_DN8588_c0_g1_i1.p1 TRINITY_DN8588_c0_g1~~TRINITY_DN8588_c0_g1_i1.p1  ORF type:complete len:188 (+),score=76.31 TRINITY_DN8588_c0_g1_i1:112-675(+)
MKSLVETATTKIPADVTVTCKSRVITVTGPRGKLVRNMKHIRAQMSANKASFNITLNSCKKKEKALLRTVCSHVSNMITGVTKGYKYSMRCVHAHFPINANFVDDGKQVEIRNFLGEKRVRRIKMVDGVIASRNPKTKDQIDLEGNSLEDVSLMASQIHGCTLVRNKDIRKFLDGIYVQTKTNIETE